MSRAMSLATQLLSIMKSLSDRGVVRHIVEIVLGQPVRVVLDQSAGRDARCLPRDIQELDAPGAVVLPAIQE